MSRQEVEPGCAGSLNPARSRNSSRSDFSFAFRNRQFADCTLRVHLMSEPVGLGRGNGTARVPLSPEAGSKALARENAKGVKEIPAATLVLVAKSKFFEGMFKGDFLEKHNKSGVDIYISEDDEEHFMDLLYFMYSASLPEHASQSLSSCIRLLVLADRFDVPDCVDEVLELLAAFIPRLSPEDALQLLSLPDSVQQSLSLGDIVDKAKKKLVETYSVLLSSPSDASFLRIPEPCLLALLDSDNLEVETEDVVVEAAMAWICNRYSDPKDQAEAVATIILPRIRFQALSPKMTLSLGSVLLTQDPSSRVGLLPPNADAAAVDSAGKARSSSSRQTAPSPGSNSSHRKRDPCTCVSLKRDRASSSSSVPASKPCPSCSIAGPRSHLEALLPKTVDNMNTDSAQNSPDSSAASADPAAPRASSENEHAEQVMRASPHATAVSFMALTKALVAYAEDKMILSGCVPRNKNLQSMLTGEACKPPRKISKAPYSLYLDIPRERCAEWIPSATYIAATSLTFVGGK